jgi:hypothetical protein
LGERAKVVFDGIDAVDDLARALLVVPESGFRELFFFESQFRF